MAAGWSKLLDIGPLADGRAEVEFSIPLKEFPRVLPLLAAPDGAARGRVAFSREGRIVVAEISVAAEATLQCQRCLSPLMWPLSVTGRAALVATPADAERVPATLETVLVPEYRVSIRDLVAEELLLALARQHRSCRNPQRSLPARRTGRLGSSMSCSSANRRFLKHRFRIRRVCNARSEKPPNPVHARYAPFARRAAEARVVH